MTSLTTTLYHIRGHHPCTSGWTKLLKHLNKTTADDKPLPYAVILASNGLDDALWCCRCEPRYDSQWRLFAVWCARQTQHLLTDQRSLNALDVAERFAHGQASEAELTAAQDAALAAWAAALDAAGDAARDAALAARDAAGDAARDAQSQAFRQLVTEGTLP